MLIQLQRGELPQDVGLRAADDRGLPNTVLDRGGDQDLHRGIQLQFLADHLSFESTARPQKDATPDNTRIIVVMILVGEREEVGLKLKTFIVPVDRAAAKGPERH